VESINGRSIEFDNVQNIDVWAAKFPNDVVVHFWLMYELDLKEYWAGWSKDQEWRQTIVPMGEALPSREETESMFLKLTHNPCSAE
jgi:hypothetical protein